MEKPKVSIIVSVASKTDAIGGKNDLLIRISDDLKRFKSLTSGHSIIMGRKTHESIGKLLPNRKSFIVTRNESYDVPGAVICKTIEEAIEKARQYEQSMDLKNNEVFIIGGAEIFRQALPMVSRIYLTLIESDVSGDVFFPEWKQFTKVLSREDRVDTKTGTKYSWINLER